MKVYGYENYNIIVCYNLYNEVTTKDEYRESPVSETILRNESYVLKADYERISSSICTSDASQVSANAKLYFDQTSKFPRYKLDQTAYKRKLKPETADYIIINTNINVDSKLLHVYTNNIDTLYLCINHVKPANENAILLDSTVIHLTSQMKSYLDLHKSNYKYLSDDQLNKLCDDYAADLTSENLDQIINLVFNNDSQNIELGLKVFASINVSKYPMTAKFLMSCVDLKHINKNITIKNLISQSGMKRNLVKDMWYDYISPWSVNDFYKTSNIPTATAEDKKYAMKIFYKFIKCHVRERDLSLVREPWFDMNEFNKV